MQKADVTMLAYREITIKRAGILSHPPCISWCLACFLRLRHV